MNIKSLFYAGVLTFAATTSSFGSTLTFGFEFSDGTDTVAGIISGLEDDPNFQQSSDVSISFNGQSIISFNATNTRRFRNTFVVVAGELTTGSFDGRNLVEDVQIQFEFSSLSNSSSLTFANGPSITGTTFTVDSRTSTIPSVPLPAGGLLLLTGLAGVVGLKRGKKQPS